MLAASLLIIPVVLLADWTGLLGLVSERSELTVVTCIIALAVGAQGTTRMAYGLLLAQGRTDEANRCFWQVVGLSAVVVPLLSSIWGVVGCALATLIAYGTLSLLMHRAAR